MPTDKPSNTMERKKMHTKHGIIPIAAYDLVFEPTGG